MKTILGLVLIFGFTFLAACNSASTSEPATETEAVTTEQEAGPVGEVGQDDSRGLSVEELMNTTYSGIYEDAVTLQDGSFEDLPFTVEYQQGRELYGDLDGDGVEDAVVFLIERGGGTAAFTYIAAQLNQDGQPVDAGAVMVEDRTQILAETITDGQVILEITTRGPGDGDCCPSYKTRRTYTLESGRLVDTSPADQELVRISADDLNGTSWSLLELNDQQPVLADSQVTISFQDYRISGSGGCNDYNSGFSLSEDNPFVMTMEPVVSTRKACPDPLLNQEDTYFKVLESVSLWGYDHGKLALAYVDDRGEYSRLLFAPQVEAGNK